MIILTDGFPNSPSDANAAATDAKDNNNIFIIGVCISCNLNQLKQMASEPKEHNVLYVNQFEVINNYIEDLANSICPPSVYNQYWWYLSYICY